MGRNAPELYVDWVGSLCGATIRASLRDANNFADNSLKSPINSVSLKFILIPMIGKFLIYQGYVIPVGYHLNNLYIDHWVFFLYYRLVTQVSERDKERSNTLREGSKKKNPEKVWSFAKPGGGSRSVHQ